MRMVTRPLWKCHMHCVCALIHTSISQKVEMARKKLFDDMAHDIHELCSYGGANGCFLGFPLYRPN